MLSPSLEKPKRRLEGLDIYSIIDRLVDELDGDELVYLQRKLKLSGPQLK